MDEVLVHISTPATRENDELFRSLATAYTRFQPFRVHAHYEVGTHLEVDAARGAKSATQDPVEASVLTASKESYGSFPSNVSSNGRHQDQSSAQLDDNDEMPPTGRLAQLDRSYLSWKERTISKSSLGRGRQEPQTSSDSMDDADTGFIEDSQSALLALQSQLQDTYSTTSENSSEDMGCQDGNDDIAIKYAASKADPALGQDGAAEGLLQLSNLLEDCVPSDPRLTSSEPADLFLPATQISQTAVNTILDRPDFSKLPMDAFPPSPAITVACPGTLPSQITKHLAILKTRNLDRFRPFKILRNLEVDERGYWHVNCTLWPQETQHNFWLSLHEHVCSGRIGWGTTLHRDHASDETLGLVRLYCWGEVVEHMWLLLWLCSRGKLVNSGSKWIDANAVPVVEML